MHNFTLIFILLILITTGLKLWLTWRQQRYVRCHRDHVPETFREHITITQHQKAAEYTAAKIQLGWVAALLNSLVLLIWTLGGGLNLLDYFWRMQEGGILITGVAVIISLLLINGLIGIPVKAYRSFILETRFGFNRMTYTTFIVDLIKNALLVGILATVLSFSTLWIMNTAEQFWWFFVWLLWTGFSLLMTWAYPILIAPLFNRFSPLHDETLKTRIYNLLMRCGFNSDGVFVIDGSKRSAHGNAYFSGIGKNKRIVFFDTLLESLSPAQIESVLAHELGHYKRSHVLKNMLMTTCLSLVSLLFLSWLSNQPWFYTGLGINQPSSYMALLIFILVGPLVIFLFQPLLAWLSRRYEFEADEFAAMHADARDLIHALLTLYRDNASSLTSDPLYSAVYDSHPSAPIRIQNLIRLSETAHQA